MRFLVHVQSVFPISSKLTNHRTVTTFSTFATDRYDWLKPVRWKINIQKDWGEVRIWFSRSEDFFTSLFSRKKLARNTQFLSKDIIVLDSDQVSCLVPIVLQLSAEKSEHFDFSILKKLQMFVRVKENFALELIKNI